ncbi:hypothetical protein MMC11_004944 [Xylographa trunciseda]|nr:hypothetical protein [Xylographa trunciseda]
MPSLMDLPPEVRAMILPRCVAITKCGETGDHGTYVPPALNRFEPRPPHPPTSSPEEAADRSRYRDGYWPSYTTPPFEAADFNGVRYGAHEVPNIRDLSVLHACRQLYREAVPLMYASNTFQFHSVTALHSFASIAFDMGNHSFVQAVVLRVNLWEERSSEMKTSWKECEDHYRDWADLLAGDGLRYYFPSLRRLVLDFAPDTYFQCRWGVAHVDGRSSGGAQPGFGGFREVLKKHVRVQEVEVYGLASGRWVVEMEREMMGLTVEYGPWDEAYYPREMYAKKPGMKLAYGRASEPYHVPMTAQEAELEGRAAELQRRWDELDV